MTKPLRSHRGKEKFTTKNPYSNETLVRYIPKKKKINGETYTLAAIYPNWGFMSPTGHAMAKHEAKEIRQLSGWKSKVVAGWGWSAVYERKETKG
jgi:hypothetical protein